MPFQLGRAHRLRDWEGWPNGVHFGSSAATVGLVLPGKWLTGHDGLMDGATERPFNAELWLRSLAADILEHEGCEGCRANAAEALERLGSIQEILARHGIEDPREARRRSMEEHRQRAAAGRPPRLRLKFDAEIVLHKPSEELQGRVLDAVREAVWDAVRDVPGASIHGSGFVAKLESS